MLRGVRSAQGKMHARPELQSMIEFRQLNLNHPSYEVHGAFDLIFCRNVLIYFNQETKAAVIDRLIRHLAPGGLLFLGHSETIPAAAHGLKHAGPAAYTKAA
jgi:chemotaxis protein methyltransferase CheR